MDKLIELKEEAVGLSLPYGPKIPVLTRVGRKKSHRVREIISFPIVPALLVILFIFIWLIVAISKEREIIQRKETVLLVIGRACIDHVTSLNKRPGPRRNLDAANIAENCGEIARLAVEKLTYGPERREKNVKVDTY